MVWSRSFSLGIAITFLVLLVAPAAQALELGGPGPAPAWSDDAPEDWIVGERVIEGVDEVVDVRFRVLPGGHLIVRDSVLRFDGLDWTAGIVAEPGGAVTIVDTLLTTASGEGYLLHFEGPFQVSNSSIIGADAVVVQPRSVTDHADDLVGDELKRSLPGWRTLRTLTAAVATLTDVTIAAPLIIGVPETYQAPPPSGPFVTLSDVSVEVDQGPALLCYETRQDPDLHGFTPLLGAVTDSTLAIEGGTLTASEGPALRCPPSPMGRTLPDRNPPLIVPITAPPPPAPEVQAGPDEVHLAGTTLRGAHTGIAADASIRYILTDVTLEGFIVGVHVDHPQVHVATSGSVARDVFAAVYVRRGSYADSGSLYEGRGPTTGLGIILFENVQAALTGTTVRSFEEGILDGAGATLTNVALQDATTCLRAIRPTTVSTSTFTDCALGIGLVTSGATITDNVFDDNRDPLRVLTLPALANYQHTVTGNTVNGRALAYVVDQNSPPVITEPVGHLVVAYSDNVRLSDVSLMHGQAHVVASSETVLGSRTASAAALLSYFDLASADAWQRIHDEVRFAPYPGSLLGPVGPLDAGSANDLDAARALVQLWRDEGRTVRFVDGVQGGETADFLDWVGMKHPGYAFAMQGIDATWFGATYELQRTWVEVEAQPGLWIEADPIYNQYDWSEPVDVLGAMGYDPDALMAAVTDGATLDYTYHGANHLDLDALHALQEDYNATAMPVIAPDDAPDGGDLVRIPTARAFGPEDDVTRTPVTRYLEVPESRLWTTRITTRDLFSAMPASAHIDFETNLSSLYGHRVSIESFPDTPEMHAAMADAGGLYGIDRHSMTFATFLKVDGEVQDFVGGVNTLAPDGVIVRTLPVDPADRPVTYNPGDLVGLDIEVRRPGGALHAVHSSPFRVGGTYSLVFDMGGSPEPLLDRRIASYNDTLQTWGHADGAEVDHGDLLAELYQIQGMAYFRRLHDIGSLVAAQNGVLEIPVASVAMTGTSVVPIFKDGVQKVAPAPPYFDIRGIDYSYPIDGDVEKLLDHRFATGVLASALEDKTFTEMYELPAVSTIKALAVAADTDVPIYHLNHTTPEALDVLDVPGPVMQSIIGAINRGWEVIVPQSEISYYNWTGVGWIEIDLTTGSAGWLIYGGTSPITGSLAIDEWPILRGGAGAQYTYGVDGRMFDWGYEDDLLAAIDWTDKGVGVVSGSVETGFRYSTISSAGNWARVRLDGVALNNYHRSLAGEWDIPGRYGSFVGKAGNAVAVVGHGADMWDIVNSDATLPSKYGQMAGVTAINVASVAAGGAVIKGFASGGALVGGAVFDGPGLVGGAIVGGVVGAISLGVAGHFAKKGWRGLFD